MEESEENEESSSESILHAIESIQLDSPSSVKTDVEQKEEELSTLRKALSLTFYDITSLKLKAESIQSTIRDSQSCDVSSVQNLLDDIFSLRTHISDSYALPVMDPPSSLHSDCTLPDELSSVDELEKSIDTLRSAVDENGSVLDRLQTIHLDFEKEFSSFPQRLSALHSNNTHLHSIIDDHTSHIRELSAELFRKDEEIAKLKESFLDTISSLDAQTDSQEGTESPSPHEDPSYRNLRETSLQLEKELSRCRAENEGLRKEIEANSVESTLLAKDARISSLQVELSTVQAEVARRQQQWEKERRLAACEHSRDLLQMKCLKAVGDSALEMVSLLEEKLVAASASRLLSPRPSLERAGVSALREDGFGLSSQGVPAQSVASLSPLSPVSPQSVPLSQSASPYQSGPLSQSIPPQSSPLSQSASPQSSPLSQSIPPQPTPPSQSLPPPSSPPVLDTILGPVPMDDPASIQRLLRRMSLRISMAEAKAESFERSCRRDELMRQELKRKCDELSEVKSEVQRLHEEGSRRKNLRRTVDVLRRNEAVYKEALRELKAQVKEKDRQLEEFQSVFDGLHKSENTVRV